MESTKRESSQAETKQTGAREAVKGCPYYDFNVTVRGFGLNKLTAWHDALRSYRLIEPSDKEIVARRLNDGTVIKAEDKGVGKLVERLGKATKVFRQNWSCHDCEGYGNSTNEPNNEPMCEHCKEIDIMLSAIDFALAEYEELKK